MSTTPVAVRNVILVTGYDYENPKNPFDFDEPALERVLDLFEQEAHLRYPLRFHLLSAARGLSAESVVFDQRYKMTSAVEGNLRALRMGGFWLRVEQRFAPVTPSHYSMRKVFVEQLEKAPDQKKVLSITDVYRYLYSFWEGASHTSPKNPVAFDAILELSFFCHASVDGVRLVNSVDRKRGSPKRDESDKDGRAKDFTGFSAAKDVAPSGFWKGIAKVFDRAYGRVRIWGADAGDDTRFYGALVRAILAARERASFGLLSQPLWDSDPIPVTDPRVLYRLGKSGTTVLSFGQVKAILGEGLQASYGVAAQEALSVTTYQAPLGTATEPERTPLGRKSKRRLFAVQKADNDVATFHQAVLGLALDPDGRRYGVLGPRPRELPEKKDAISPIAGVQLFHEYTAPLALEGPTGRTRRDRMLQTALEAVLRAYGLNYTMAPEIQPAIAIADVSGSPPYPYAATPNDEVPYYSASLLKVAAMFAACRARSVLGELKIELKDLAPYFSATIVRAFDFSRAKVKKGEQWPDLSALLWEHRAPHFETLLEPKSGQLKVSEAQLENVRRIFHQQRENPEEDQSNQGARGLIHSLGYSWINSVLRLSGFPGVWLAGDYSGSKDWPSAQIPSFNSSLAAQVTTARDLAALMATIARDSLREAEQMRSWLGQGGSWLESTLQSSGFKVVGAKVGLTPGRVHSEATILEKEGTTRKFVVVWQNCPRETHTAGTVLAIVRQTLQAYAP